MQSAKCFEGKHCVLFGKTRAKGQEFFSRGKKRPTSAENGRFGPLMTWRLGWTVYWRENACAPFDIRPNAGGDLKFEQGKTKSQHSLRSNAVGDFNFNEKKLNLSQADDLSS